MLLLHGEKGGVRNVRFHNIILFFFLMFAVWQDIKYRGVEERYYLIFGMAGVVFAFLQGRTLLSVCGSAGVGVLLLVLGWLSGGGIGEGDGWFFVVTGFFLAPQDNLALLLSGLFFCSLYSLTLTAAAFGSGANIRKLKVPFLPFLLPVGLWLVFL